MNPVDVSKCAECGSKNVLVEGLQSDDGSWIGVYCQDCGLVDIYEISDTMSQSEENGRKSG